MIGRVNVKRARARKEENRTTFHESPLGTALPLPFWQPTGGSQPRQAVASFRSIPVVGTEQRRNDPIGTARKLWTKTPPIFAPANDISANVAMLKIAPGGNSITPLEFRGSQDGSRYEATLWHRAGQRFSLLKHRGGEIALTEFDLTELDLDTYCVSEYKLK